MTRYEAVQACKIKLLNLLRSYERTLNRDMQGLDEKKEVIDLAASVQQFSDSSYHRGRIQGLLPEIRSALARIENGSFGICEETGEEIEAKRLLAVPWTRVSMKALVQLEAS